MIKAIIFDMGGVLVDLDLERCKKTFVEEVGYEGIDDIIDACHQKGFYSELEEGLISEDDFRNRILSKARSGATAHDVDRAMWSLLTGIEGYKADLLKRLSFGYDLYLLSNNNGISMVRCREIFRESGIPMDLIFRRQFLSYQMKMLKPSERIYKAVISSVGIPAEEMLFIDDSQANIDAAAAEGMKSVLYTPGTDLKTLVSDALEVAL